MNSAIAGTTRAQERKSVFWHFLTLLASPIVKKTVLDDVIHKSSVATTPDDKLEQALYDAELRRKLDEVRTSVAIETWDRPSTTFDSLSIRW